MLRRFQEAIKAHETAIKLAPGLANIKGKNEVKKVPKYDEKDSHCIGCNSNNTEIVFVCNQSMVGNNFEVLNPIRIWKGCNDCRLVFAGNMPSGKALDEYYAKNFVQMLPGGTGFSFSEMGNPEGYLKYSRNRIVRIEKFLGKKGRILDVGAGAGTFIKTCIDHGWQSTGLEFSPERVAYANKKWSIELLQQDFFDMDMSNKFDVITLFEVIEHLVKPWDALQKAAELLNNGGILVIATPFRDSKFSMSLGLNDFWWNEPAHLTYMDTQSLIINAQKFGLKLITVDEGEEGAGRLEVYLQKENVTP